MILSSLVALSLFSGVASGRALQGDTCEGLNLWTMDEVRSYSTTTACLVVLYDTVYDLKNFASVHRGGPASILRNCGRDATFGYESLVCIPGVPDHTVGVLNMVSDVKVGVIKGSPKDPCSDTYPPPPDPEPDFDACGVYDVVTCADLASMPNNGLWSHDDVVNSSTDSSCIVQLYDYVFDVGSPPQESNRFTPPNSGMLTFAEKHGGGPEAVTENCRKDLTEKFAELRNMPGVPNHTEGALNAILPYLVGVIQGSMADPCEFAPPPICPDELPYWTMTEVQQATTGCIAVVLGKVYDLAGFAEHHYGGSGEIRDACREDITDDFLEKSFHTLVQLGAIQQFQVGVIEGSMADPCSSNYDANPNPLFGESGDEDGDEDSDGEDGDEDGGGDDGGSSFLNWCFPGEATLDVSGRGLVALKDVKIGDRVLVDGDGHFEKIYGFGHKDQKGLNNYLQLTTASGARLEISKDHLIFVSGKGTVPASQVTLGDKLFVLNDLDAVQSITNVTRRGAYAPFTPSGTIIVDGIKTSSFVALQDSPDLVIGGVSTGLSFHWMEHTFELPHRLWCSHIASCENEEYTQEGISKWADGPHKVALWFLTQNGTVMLFCALLLFLWLWSLALLNWMVANMLTILAFGAACICWNTFFRIRMTSSHDKKEIGL